MTVKEIFALRKQGHIEEAYEAIRPMYRVHPGHYTTICMYHCARDVFNLRLIQGRTEEARKIFLALQRLVPFLSDRDGRVTAFMQYASSRLDHAAGAATVPDGSPSGCPAPSSLVSPFHGAPEAPVPCASPSGNSVPSCSSPLDGAPEAPYGDCAQRFCRCDISPKLQRLLAILDLPLSVRQMMALLGFHSRDKFLTNYLTPAIKAGLIEMTDPNSPKSPKQRYRRAKGDK